MSDKPMRHIIEDNEGLAAECGRLQSELTAARDEAEKLRGRASELEASCITYESRLRDYAEYMERVPRMILRKQAEAVEAIAQRLQKNKADWSWQAQQELLHSAQTLRARADAIKKGGS